MAKKKFSERSRFSRWLLLALQKQYASIGGQAVIEGVMMRSPNAFVVAVRKPDGKILLRRDQWFGLGKKFEVFKKPFLRGVLVLIESMANGIVSLNYSANIAMDEEKKKEALEKGISEEDYEKEKKKKEKVNWSTFLSMIVSFALGIGLFVFAPHTLTEWMSNLLGANWSLQSFQFHAIDGTIKACIFILYVFLIGFLPDIRRVFQYHGAEHKSISTFEAGEELNVDNAEKFTTLHPRCGTSFVFFLLFISIVLFSVLFVFIPLEGRFPYLIKHLVAILIKVAFMLPIAGISYEVIKLAGKYPNKLVCKGLSLPGMALQKLTTKNPDREQLEVALTSIKTVLNLEEKFNLKEVKEKVIQVEEIEIDSIDDIENSSSQLKDFLEG